MGENNGGRARETQRQVINGPRGEVPAGGSSAPGAHPHGLGGEVPGVRSSARAAHLTLAEYVAAEALAEAEAIRAAELALASGDPADRAAAAQAQLRFRQVIATRPAVIDELLEAAIEQRFHEGP